MHSGHRERMKEKFLRYGGEAFGDHELLEILLFFSIPRKNTNDLAHTLIDRFGSLRGVFDATVQNLMSVEGVGLSSALLIKLVSALFFRYNLNGGKPKVKLGSYLAVSNFIKNLFVGESEEKVYLIMLNNSLGLVEYKLLGAGSVKVSAVSTREILESCIVNNAAYAIIAHNHPNGVALPSGLDMEATQAINNALRYAQVELIDHFIFAEDRCTPILRGMDTSTEESFDRALESMALKKR